MKKVNNRGGVNVLVLGKIMVVIGVICCIFAYADREKIMFNDSKEYILLKDVRNIINSDLTLETDSGNLEKENYLFLGDSITYRYQLEKYFPDLPVVNSGVEGNKTSDIIVDIKERVYIYNPTKVFLLIGTNQLEEESAEEIFEGIVEIVSLIREKRGASIYVLSIYPVNKEFRNSPAKGKDNTEIREINAMIKEYSRHHNIYYVDVYSALSDDEGDLKKEYSIDGLHLSDKGYDKVTDVLEKYVKE